MTPSLQHVTNTFVLSSTSKARQILFEIPQSRAVHLSRQRRAHRKSSLGCMNCRNRRVKCNEATPCANCTRRKEHCQHIVRNISLTSVPTNLTHPILPYSRINNPEVYLFHVKLFNHFQTHTRQTLLHGPEVWGHALQLCFHFDYLMNAILGIAARHLAFLQPVNEKYPIAATSHLCHALSGFRKELSKDFSSISLDAFIATSTLFQYEVWSCADFYAPEDSGVASFDPSKDPIFGLSAQLKQVFLKVVPSALGQSSIFMPYVRLDPTDALVAAARISNATWIEYQDLFSYKHPLISESVEVPVAYIRDEQSTISNSWKGYVPSDNISSCAGEDAYRLVIARICLILSFLPESHPPDPVNSSSLLMQELTRCVFSFPMLCRGLFADMIQKNDPHALLLLYHFYRAVGILLPATECWWTYQRAVIAETALRRLLLQQGTKST